MKIKLIQSGGFIPITRVASAEVDWTKEESDNLIRQIAVIVNQPPSQVRDGIWHTVEIDGKEIPVDVDKASGKFADVLDKLKMNLKILKQ